MADIQKIVINGETYSVKDAQARADFLELVGEYEEDNEYVIDCGDARNYVSKGYIEH